jgi:hypothetical protein
MQAAKESAMETRMFGDLISLIAIIGYAVVVGIIYSFHW